MTYRQSMTVYKRPLIRATVRAFEGIAAKRRYSEQIVASHRQKMNLLTTLSSKYE